MTSARDQSFRASARRRWRGAGQRSRSIAMCRILRRYVRRHSIRDRANFIHFDAQVNYKPMSALRATLSYTKERLVRYDTKRVAFDENIIRALDLSIQPFCFCARTESTLTRSPQI